MCIIQASYFTKNGSGMSGPSCSAYSNDVINAEIAVTFSGAEIGKAYAAEMKIRRPDGNEVWIASTYKTVSSTESFTFGNWSTPIPIGTYTALESRIIDTYGDTKCSGIPSGGFCQSLTISSPPTPTKYRCTGAPNYLCVEDPSGPYNSLAECQSACTVTQAGIGGAGILLMAGLAIGAIYMATRK